MKYCFGVDIGGTTVKLGLFTTEGEIVDKWEIKTRTENQGEAVLPDIAAALNEKLEEKQIPKDEVEGIGVGGGIIIDGKPLVGAHGAGGEIGHLCVNYEETDHCGCGNTGCLEQYASATGITRLANIRLAKDDKASVLRGQEVSAKTVFDAVKADDEVAKEIAEEFGKYLGHAMANLAAVADPSAIVIGGGVSKAGEVLLQYVEKNFKEKAFFANKDTEFVLATLGNDAGICGAAKLIL